MTRVLKPADAALRGVRAFAEAPIAPIGPVAPQVDPVVVALRAERDALLRVAQARDEEIAKLQAEVERAFREGEAIGLKIGRDEAQEDRATALAELKAGIEGALAILAREIAALERLAPLVAQRGLSLILGENESRAELVATIVRRQIEQIGAHAVVRVEVSRSDFPEPAELAATLVRAGVELRAVDELAGGQCRIGLALGGLEVGVDQQWRRLSAVLDELAAPKAIA